MSATVTAPVQATISPPRREVRAPQPYVAIRSDVTMAQLSTHLPPLSPELLRWMTARGLAPSGPVFWRYLVIDMDALLTVEVGFPVAQPATGDDRVTAGILPGGTYVVTRHHGHPAGLEQATGELLAWGEREAVDWDRHPEGAGEAWRSRIEWYLNDGDDDVPMADWDTELAFLTR